MVNKYTKSFEKRFQSLVTDTATFKNETSCLPYSHNN